MSFKSILFKLKWRKMRPAAFVRFAEFKANERKSADELETMQEAARQRIVRYALLNSPFYREFYGKAGIKLEDIGTPGWFERLPILTKTHLREYFDEIFVPELRRFTGSSTTGGSTGVPTRTGYDRRINEEAYSWRMQSWYGVAPWDHHAYIWRDTKGSRLARMKNALMWWPTKHLKLDASFITDGQIERFLKDFNKIRPSLVFGYVGAVTQVAQYIIDHGIVVAPPKMVWVTSAPISSVQRALVKKAFRCESVCDQYGSCEVRWLAQQCAEGKGLHVNIEHVNIEFVDEANRPVPKGEYGKTLLTNLEDMAFPIIRYENGDRGRWLKEPCSCGRTLPCIDSVKGRESESFTLPSGKTINGEFLTTIFDAKPELVNGFRVVQHKDLSITVEYIPVGTLDEITGLLKGFAARIGEEVSIDFKGVEEIQHDRGKIRFVVKE